MSDAQPPPSAAADNRAGSDDDEDDDEEDSVLFAPGAGRGVEPFAANEDSLGDVIFGGGGARGQNDDDDDEECDVTMRSAMDVPVLDAGEPGTQMVVVNEDTNCDVFFRVRNSSDAPAKPAVLVVGDDQRNAKASNSGKAAASRGGDGGADDDDEEEEFAVVGAQRRGRGLIICDDDDDDEDEGDAEVTLQAGTTARATRSETGEDDGLCCGRLTIISEDTQLPDLSEDDERAEMVRHRTSITGTTVYDPDDDTVDGEDSVVMASSTKRGAEETADDVDAWEDPDKDEDDVVFALPATAFTMDVDDTDESEDEAADSGDSDENDGDVVIMGKQEHGWQPQLVLDETDEESVSDEEEEEEVSMSMSTDHRNSFRARKLPFDIDITDDDEDEGGGKGEEEPPASTNAICQQQSDDDDDDEVVFGIGKRNNNMTVSDEEDEDDVSFIPAHPQQFHVFDSTLSFDQDDETKDKDEDDEEDDDDDDEEFSIVSKGSCRVAAVIEDITEDGEAAAVATAQALRSRLCVGNIPTVGGRAADDNDVACAAPPFVQREKECAFIREYLSACSFAGVSGCFYVSGPPGTGKTTAVRGIIDEARRRQGGACWKEVYLNCIKLSCTSQTQLFAAIAHQLGCKAPTQHAVHARLCSRSDAPVALVVDEADALFAHTHRRALFALFTLPLLPGSRCVLVAIANATRPPPSFWKKLRSRIGVWHVHFSPYTARDLEDIASSRMRAVPGAASVLSRDALHHMAVRLAATCGDARRMLHICRTAIDNALLRHRTGWSNSSSSSSSSSEATFVAQCDVDMAVEDILVLDPRVAVIAALSPAQVLALALLQRQTAGDGSGPAAWVGVEQLVDASAARWKQHAAGTAPASFGDVLQTLCQLAHMGLVTVHRQRAPADPAFWQVQCLVPRDVIDTAVAHHEDTQQALAKMGWLP